MKSNYLWILAIVICSCGGLNVGFELPRLDGLFPRETGPIAAPSADAASRNEETTKTAVIDFVYGTGVASSLNIDPTKNCVQLVQFSNGQVAIDFYDTACPNPIQTLPVSSLKFTLTYKALSDTRFDLMYNNQSVGEMVIDFDKPEVTLKELCNDYKYDCLITEQGSRYEALVLY